MTELEKEQALEIRALQHKIKVRESYFNNECAKYETKIKELKDLIKYYKKSGDTYYLISKEGILEYDDYLSLLSYIEFMDYKEYKVIKGVIIDEGE